MEQSNLWHLAKNRIQTVKEYSNHEVLKQYIPKIYEWAKKNNLVIHGGHAVHLQLLHVYKKGLYDNESSSVDLYGKNLTDIREQFKKDFKEEALLHADRLDLIINETLVATISKHTDIDKVNELPVGKVIPIEQSISIYWAILNGHALQLYNIHLNKYARYLLKIADIMQADLPAPYEFVGEPKYKYPIELPKDTYITGQNIVVDGGYTCA